jgi:hypothetical protein
MVRKRQLRWAERVGAKASKPRQVQRGARYAATITDYRKSGRLVATLCEVDRLGHAWSGGVPGMLTAIRKDRMLHG